MGFVTKPSLKSSCWLSHTDKSYKGPIKTHYVVTSVKNTSITSSQNLGRPVNGGPKFR